MNELEPANFRLNGWRDHPRMVINMDEAKLRTIAQLKKFLDATQEIKFTGPPRSLAWSGVGSPTAGSSATGQALLEACIALCAQVHGR
jgi:hypothetical protein